MFIYYTLKDRAFQALNLEQYSNDNTVDKIGDELELEIPKERQYYLRILIKRMFGVYQIPEELEWCRPFVEICAEAQRNAGINQPFVYLTVRSGKVDSTTDDEWHVDGFSQSITHLPEQNYLWTDNNPTEYVEQAIDFPSDFDSMRHNIHTFLQNRVDNSKIKTMKEKCIYGMDPYIIHRRPPLTSGTNRCFLRLSFTPIEIEDVNNTYNPLIPTNYKRDGVKEFRDNLEDYDAN